MFAKNNLMKDVVRPIGLAWVAIGFGSLLVLLIEALLDLEVSKVLASSLTFVFAAFAAFFVFPGKLKVPFGDVGLSAYLRGLGFYLPRQTWKHVLLGILLAVCTLLGMLVGSLLSGRYEFDPSTIDISHMIFSVNPALWEEFFYRGVIMIVLLKATRSLRKAALIQIVLFGLSHVKGLDLWSLVDVVSVTIIGVVFTYSAYKTRTLVVGILFHFIHDAFLFVPQLPGAEYIGVMENAVFLASLWLMVGVDLGLIKLFSDSLGVKADAELYTLDLVQYVQ
jgi:membrane protease YdiL (CAAX protease family)